MHRDVASSDTSHLFRLSTSHAIRIKIAATVNHTLSECHQRLYNFTYSWIRKCIHTSYGELVLLVQRVASRCPSFFLRNPLRASPPSWQPVPRQTAPNPSARRRDWHEGEIAEYREGLHASTPRRLIIEIYAQFARLRSNEAIGLIAVQI